MAFQCDRSVRMNLGDHFMKVYFRAYLLLYLSPSRSLLTILNMIRKRTRPQPRLRQVSIEREDEPPSSEELEGHEKLESVRSVPSFALSLTICSLTDLIELRKLRRARQGIDIVKLSKGDAKKKKKKPKEPEGERGGLKKGAEVHEAEDE